MAMMLRPYKCFWLALLSVWVGTKAAPSHSTVVPVEVQTKLGQINGTESIFLHRRVRSFLSVPFAEPPVGEGRFKPPRAKRPWNGTIDATVMSPACYQGRDMYNVTFWGSEMWNPNTPVSEDCLYLNIWAPADAYNLTVMVWIFGGGFFAGSPSLILYDGRALALQGNVVVVNLNYRVGPFGYLFFDHDDAPGNVGMLDQQLALHWIREHIFNFGGNPSRITLFGESAGASSIVAHMIAPGSRHLFRNGILQSGSLDNAWALDTPKRAMEKSWKMAELVGCNTTEITQTLKCMRDVPAQGLIDQIWNLPSAFLEFPLVIVSRDRNFFRQYDAFHALRTGQFRTDVDIMIGINHDEGNFWNIYNLPEFFDKQSEQPKLTRSEFYQCVDKAFAIQPEVIRNAAKFVYSDANCSLGSIPQQFYAEQVNQMVGDYFFTCDSIWFADELEKRGGNVFIYYFDQPSSANPWPKWTGVMHGYEIEFVFGVPIYNETAGYTPREQTFARKIVQYWASFANDSIPRLHTMKASDVWPRYMNKPGDRKWMYLKGGSAIAPIDAMKRVECDLWRTARDMQYRAYVAESTSPAAVLLYSSFILQVLVLAAAVSR